VTCAESRSAILLDVIALKTHFGVSAELSLEISRSMDEKETTNIYTIAYKRLSVKKYGQAGRQTQCCRNYITRHF
jgi:hypothetical protein